MSRRSSRRIPAKKAASLPSGITTGLASLVEGNEAVISRMLSVAVSPKNNTAEARSQLATALADCMAVNDLSAEALLARFFDPSVLSAYCEHRLGASGKGNVATLAARIARAWSRAGWVALPREGVTPARGAPAPTKAQGATAAKRKEKEDGNGTGKRRREDGPWCAATVTPASFVRAPPGPLGITLKEYAGEFVVTDVAAACPVATGPARIKYGDTIVSVDGARVESVQDVDRGSEEGREIGLGARVISMNAADHSRGKLLLMKETGCGMFRIMDYSRVADKYGEKFLTELDPPNRGRTGRQILAGAFSSLGKS